MTFKLTAGQRLAEKEFINFLSTDERFMVVSGSSGTGKTTITPHLIRAAQGYSNMSNLAGVLGNQATEVKLCATTNPAAAIMQGMCNSGDEVKTIHSLLGVRPVDDFKTGGTYLVGNKGVAPVYNSLVIIDEGSLLSDSPKNNLMKYIDDKLIDCKILIIGDQNQLAPVGQLTTVMEKLKCRKVELSQIMRNGGLIAKTGQDFCRAVSTKRFEPIKIDNKSIYHTNDGEMLKKAITNMFTHKNYHPNFVKILTRTNRIVQGYNKFTRKVMGLPPEFQVGETVKTNKPILPAGGTDYRRVVDSEVRITSISKEFIFMKTGIKGKMVSLDGAYSGFLPTNPFEAKDYLQGLYNQKKYVLYFKLKNSWMDLRSPYASTVHKAQGASYDNVIINLNDIGTERIASELARLLYVAITRARKKVILYGNLPPYLGGGIIGR